MVYTPMGILPTINVMANALFGSSHKTKVYPLTLVLCWIVISITQHIKKKLDNMSV